MFFSRTTGPISTKHGKKHPSVKSNEVCLNEVKDLALLQKKIKERKYISKLSKYSSPEPLS